MTYRLSFSDWLQMSEPITHMDTDDYMTIHHKGTSYFDSTAHFMLLCNLFFMMNCHVIIRIHVCNWFTHLQPE